MRIATLLCLMLAASTAAAEPGATIAAKTAPPRHAISLHLLSLDTRGLAIEGERRLRPRLSAVAGLALRAPAGGDYESLAITGSGEARWWIKGAITGPYLGARIDLSRASIRAVDGGQRIGQTLTVAESLTAGWRFAFWGRLEITPSASLGLRHEIDLDGRLAPWTRASLGLALTAGVLF